MFSEQISFGFFDLSIGARGEIGDLRAKWREARKAYRENHPEKIRRDHAKRRKKRGYPFKTWLCANARFRGRKRGFEATIVPADLIWPTHCPVLGIELDYPERSGMRKTMVAQPNWPSLDRWDSSKGYVPGNVFVISYRANTLKNSATLDEALRIVKYLRAPPCLMT